MIGIGGMLSSRFLLSFQTEHDFEGTIGTALFVQIGGTLVKGGPGKRNTEMLCHLTNANYSEPLLGFHDLVYFYSGRQQLPWYGSSFHTHPSPNLYLSAEMVSWMPISSPFVSYFCWHFVGVSRQIYPLGPIRGPLRGSRSRLLRRNQLLRVWSSLDTVWNRCFQCRASILDRQDTFGCSDNFCDSNFCVSKSQAGNHNLNDVWTASLIYLLSSFMEVSLHSISIFCLLMVSQSLNSGSPLEKLFWPSVWYSSLSSRWWVVTLKKTLTVFVSGTVSPFLMTHIHIPDLRVVSIERPRCTLCRVCRRRQPRPIPWIPCMSHSSFIHYRRTGLRFDDRWRGRKSKKGPSQSFQ